MAACARTAQRPDRRPRPAGRPCAGRGRTVGHHGRAGARPRAPSRGADVRGAAPGTRETDLLRPDATVQRVHAIVLSGGIGVRARRGRRRDGPPGGGGHRVPGARRGRADRARRRGVRPRSRRGVRRSARRAATGAAAVDAATDGPVARGRGRGGRGRASSAGGRAGSGTASAVLDSGATVAALVVLNAVGSARRPGLRACRTGCGPRWTASSAPVAPVAAAAAPQPARRRHGHHARRRRHRPDAGQGGLPPGWPRWATTAWPGRSPRAHRDGRRHDLRAVHLRPAGARAGGALRAAGGRGRRRHPGRRCTRCSRAGHRPESRHLPRGDVGAVRLG